MVLDPISTVSLISNIAQFVDLGCKIFSTTSELYKSASGHLEEDRQLEVVADSLEELVARESSFALDRDGKQIRAITRFLSGPGQGYTKQESTLHKVAATCKDVAQDLSSTLGSFKDSGGKRTKHKAFTTAIRRMKDSGKIRELTQRMNTVTSSLTVCLASMVNEKQSAMNVMLDQWIESSQIRHSDLKTDIRKISMSNKSLVKQVEELNEALSSLLKQSKTNPRTDDQSTPGFSIWAPITGLTTWFGQASGSVQGPVFVDKKGHLVFITNHLYDWLETEQRVRLEQRFLDYLHYEAMETRHSKITEAHEKTFHWILEGECATISGSNYESFLSWLRHDSGVYWIAGKAGSGKSTLMKYLTDEDRTKTALKAWAGTNALFVASYFFWRPGTDLQKSREGLLRSLLYGVLCQYPKLINHLFPSRWQRLLDCRNENRGFPVSMTWSYSELVKACGELAKQNIIPARFCFFVDGMDEYEGDCEELVDLLSKISDMSSNFKTCISSRPWPTFRKAFGNGPKLFLEDLTRNDITQYVNSELGQNRLYSRMRSMDGKCDDFVKEVVDKANGVFLWVFLVVKSILRGLRNEDRLVDLQKRLSQLPSDLEKFFQVMLEGIEDVYRESSAEAFQMVLKAKEPLTLLTFSFMDDDDPDYAIKREVCPMDRPELFYRHDSMHTRINARCKDLLEVTKVGTGNWAGGTTRSGYKTLLTWKHVSLYRVDFLHRTVKDFLETMQTQTLIQSRLSRDIRFESRVAEAVLAQVKSVPTSIDTATTDAPARIIDELVKDMVPYIQSSRRWDLLECLVKTLDMHLQTHSNMTDWIPDRTLWEHKVALQGENLTLALAAHLNIVNYVSEKLSTVQKGKDPSLLALLLAIAGRNNANEEERTVDSFEILCIVMKSILASRRRN